MINIFLFMEYGWVQLKYLFGVEIIIVNITNIFIIISLVCKLQNNIGHSTLCKVNAC